MKKPEALQRRREAGLMLITACERALSVAGPGSLARLMGRSKAVAHRSVEYQRQGGNRLGELSARHLVGLVLHNAGTLYRGDFLAKAVPQFEAVLRDYQRLGLTHEIIRAWRDKAITKFDMG